MHNIEPHYKWRDSYISSKDERSPFFGRTYSEFQYSNKIYNYFIHPQWDEFGSATLYMKIIFADYEERFAIIELIGEWNDCITNDIMFIKREVADKLMKSGIYKFILLCENVLNFHGHEDDYYQEWYEDVSDERGWIALVNTLDHVAIEMQDHRLYNYIHFKEPLDDVNWRILKPRVLFTTVQQIVYGGSNLLSS